MSKCSSHKHHTHDREQRHHIRFVLLRTAMTWLLEKKKSRNKLRKKELKTMQCNRATIIQKYLSIPNLFPLRNSLIILND